ncbi:WxL domain-containing protein [Levilactobacillus bambusae]|uniref:WxL domain-containing protein n=1 Tax=Levilactobacillus bambusae TaxID=2024736 RepID=A0A2V1MZU5_9LACO|nr:WxL domain-containing protein [Levilactobacillus bambusae]PWF99684.1 hypothetical protein DCM90_07665 [Levilactobacillus bambusae]
MKKMMLGFTSMAIAATLLGAGGNTVNAATTNDKVSTQAEFTVKNGDITLNSAPHLNFGETSLDKLTNGNVKLDLQNNTKTNGNDNTGKDALTVTNYDATAKTWNVTATASDFQETDKSTGAQNGTVLAGAKILVNTAKVATVNEDSSKSNNQAKGTSSLTNIMGQGAVVLSGNPSFGTTTAAVSEANDAQLDLSGVDATKVSPDKAYTADIDWTLAINPTAQAAD